MHVYGCHLNASTAWDLHNLWKKKALEVSRDAREMRLIRGLGTYSLALGNLLQSTLKCWEVLFMIPKIPRRSVDALCVEVERKIANKFHKNFSTVGSFFTHRCRWQTPSVFLCFWLHFAKYYLHERHTQQQGKSSSTDQMLQTHKFQRDVPKNIKVSSPRVWINIFYYSATRNFHKKKLYCVRFGSLSLFFFCWMNLLPYNNERASQHSDWLYIHQKGKKCFYAFARYFYCDIFVH